MRPTTRCAVWVTMICFALGTAALAATIKVPNRGWKTYRGAWFTIKYPIGFTTKVREAGASQKGGQPDGVSFLSPDGQVEFYIYSPQWAGDPAWIKLGSGETERSRKVVTSGKDITTHKTFTYVTILGPGRHYERSYVDIRQPDQKTRWVFGYKYRSTEAYKAYLPHYLKFKASLQQFAD
jgi:hypothetical protein